MLNQLSFPIFNVKEDSYFTAIIKIDLRYRKKRNDSRVRNKISIEIYRSQTTISVPRIANRNLRNIFMG